MIPTSCLLALLVLSPVESDPVEADSGDVAVDCDEKERDTQAKADKQDRHSVWLDGEGATDGARIELGWEFESRSGYETGNRSNPVALRRRNNRSAYVIHRVRVFGILGKPDEKKAYGEFSSTSSEGGVGARWTVGSWTGKRLKASKFRDKFQAFNLEGGVVVGVFNYEPVGSGKLRAYRPSWSLAAGYRLFESRGEYKSVSPPNGATIGPCWRDVVFETASVTLHAVDLKLKYSRSYKAESAVAAVGKAPVTSESVDVRVIDPPTNTPKLSLTLAYSIAPKSMFNNSLPMALAFGLTPQLEGAEGGFEPVTDQGTLRFDAVFYMFAKPSGAKSTSRFGIAPFITFPLYGTKEFVPGIALRVRKSTALLQW